MCTLCTPRRRRRAAGRAQESHQEARAADYAPLDGEAAAGTQAVPFGAAAPAYLPAEEALGGGKRVRG